MKAIFTIIDNFFVKNSNILFLPKNIYLKFGNSLLVSPRKVFFKKGHFLFLIIKFRLINKFNKFIVEMVLSPRIFFYKEGHFLFIYNY